MKKLLIDVSEHQGAIDWEKVKPHIDGAIIRCGYGMDQTDQDDEQWKRNADECTRLGIPFGVYIYSYSNSIERTKSEAAHVLRLVNGYNLSYPIYLDLEENGTQSGAVERANIFGDIIEGAGYVCGMYANLNWWNNYLHGLDRFTRWVAQYYRVCEYDGEYDMWQYSSSGQIDGISGRVDMNECYRDFPSEIESGENIAKKPVEEKAYIPSVKEWQEAAIADGFSFPKYGADGVWGAECASVAEIAVCKVRNFYAYPNLTRLVQKSVGVDVDGKFGKNTKSAVISYQRRNGLSDDGEVGINTWKKILAV